MFSEFSELPPVCELVHVGHLLRLPLSFLSLLLSWTRCPGSWWAFLDCWCGVARVHWPGASAPSPRELLCPGLAGLSSPGPLDMTPTGLCPLGFQL